MTAQTPKQEREGFEKIVADQHGCDEYLDRSCEGYTDGEVDFASSVYKAALESKAATATI